MSSVVEVLLTVLAASQEGYKGKILGALIPGRLATTYRRLQRNGYVERDRDGVYLSELGSAELLASGHNRPFATE